MTFWVLRAPVDPRPTIWVQVTRLRVPPAVLRERPRAKAGESRLGYLDDGRLRLVEVFRDGRCRAMSHVESLKGGAILELFYGTAQLVPVGASWYRVEDEVIVEVVTVNRPVDDPMTSTRTTLEWRDGQLRSARSVDGDARTWFAGEALEVFEVDEQGELLLATTTVADGKTVTYRAPRGSGARRAAPRAATKGAKRPPRASAATPLDKLLEDAICEHGARYRQAHGDKLAAVALSYSAEATEEPVLAFLTDDELGELTKELSGLDALDPAEWESHEDEALALGEAVAAAAARLERAALRSAFDAALEGARKRLIAEGTAVDGVVCLATDYALGELRASIRRLNPDKVARRWLKGAVDAKRSSPGAGPSRRRPPPGARGARR